MWQSCENTSDRKGGEALVCNPPLEAFKVRNVHYIQICKYWLML